MRNGDADRPAHAASVALEIAANRYGGGAVRDDARGRAGRRADAAASGANAAPVPGAGRLGECRPGAALGVAAAAARRRTSEQFADIGNTPQGQFLEGGAFDDQGNLWFVAITTGWISYLTPEGKLVPVVNCNPPEEFGQTCEPQGTRWHDGKLYLTSRHSGILVYDPQTKKLSTLVYTYRNQLFKGPNDLDFDADGNLYFTDPWGTGPGPSMADRTGAVYQYSKDGVLRRMSETGISRTASRCRRITERWRWPTMPAAGSSIIRSSTGPARPAGPARPTAASDFFFSKAGTYVPGNGGPDGIHYDVHGNSGSMLHGLAASWSRPGGIIIGFVPIPNGDVQTTNFAGGPDNRTIYSRAPSADVLSFQGALSRLIGPGGTGGGARSRRTRMMPVAAGPPRDHVDQFRVGIRCATWA